MIVPWTQTECYASYSHDKNLLAASLDQSHSIGIMIIKSKHDSVAFIVLLLLLLCTTTHIPSSPATCSSILTAQKM